MRVKWSLRAFMGFRRQTKTPKTGVITSTTACGLLRVLRDGAKHPQTFHPDFLEPTE